MLRPRPIRRQQDYITKKLFCCNTHVCYQKITLCKKRQKVIWWSVTFGTVSALSARKKYRCLLHFSIIMSHSACRAHHDVGSKTKSIKPRPMLQDQDQDQDRGRSDWIEYSLTPRPRQYRSFRRRSSQPITWLLMTRGRSETSLVTRPRSQTPRLMIGLEHWSKPGFLYRSNELSPFIIRTTLVQLMNGAVVFPWTKRLKTYGLTAFSATEEASRCFAKKSTSQFVVLSIVQLNSHRRTGQFFLGKGEAETFLPKNFRQRLKKLLI